MKIFQWIIAVSAYLAAVSISSAPIPSEAGHEKNSLTPQSETKWIWYPEKEEAAENQTRYFRKKLVLDSKVKTAQLFITADDSCKIYINGALSQPNANQPGDWRVVKQHNIKSLLQKGENVIAAEVKNGSGAAGLILRGEIITDAGKKINLYTNDSWRSSRQNYPIGKATLSRMPPGFRLKSSATFTPAPG